MNKCDMANIFYGDLNDLNQIKAWEYIQKSNNDHLMANPICEICGLRSSARITPLGTIKAACLQCCNDIWEQVAFDALRPSFLD